MLTFGSLFAGIGGIDLGLERAGMTCAWQVEIDDYATRVLAKHWPNVPRHRDVREVGEHNLSRVDVIAGGFPCQDISNAGKRAGIDGERSGLWAEFHRIICELRPRYVFVENVAALLHRGLDRVLGDLAESGYDAEWQCFYAASVGAPHLRERIFLLAYPASERRQQQPRSSARTNETDGREIDQRRAALPTWEPSSAREGHRAGTMADADGTRLAQRQGVYDNAAKELAAFERSCRTGAGIWAAEPAICRVVDGFSGRVDRLRGLGNAVVPQAAEFVGRLIVEHAQRD